MRIYLPAVLLVVPFATTIAQEQVPPPEPGERVRVQSCTPVCQEIEGTCEAMERDTLLVRTAEQEAPVPIPVGSLLKVEVQRGQRRATLRGATTGLLVGAGGGALAGGIGDCGEWEQSACILIGAGFFGVAGLFVGGFIGSLVETDRWEEVPLDQLRVSVMPGRDGVALAMSVAF
jgi:hypothetical protein